MAAVGEQSCLETFWGVVQVPPGHNRYWEAGDCLDSPEQFFVCSLMVLSTLLKVLKLILGYWVYLQA